MTYSPSVAPRPVATARPVVTVGTVTDERQDGQANTAQFGTIRGGYGNPLRRLAAPQPVAEVVAQGFRDALAARGLLAGGGSGAYELRVRVIRYNANKLIRTEANTQFQAVLVNRATGIAAWTGEGRSDLIEAGNIVAAGIIADPEELRSTMLRSMAAAIDQILDRPDFLAALR
ncbi:hypothetical protein J8J14_08155 [Roseomonas sp. SSH11]|uniref:Lipoprotein n=1 Tax=Pararoseomonas baculiformis TaxID=2820812 RepID=A0ABS4ACM0_9PROT|nr:hypothetical protein [Pararoseomonas baculiformis]MBP0444755.1 hypothetical protein [Pararoseomonas baculiformis]